MLAARVHHGLNQVQRAQHIVAPVSAWLVCSLTHLAQGCEMLHRDGLVFGKYRIQRVTI